jgi:hypothetical protein
MGTASSTSVMVDQTIESITEQNFETTLDCVSKSTKKKSFKQRIKNCPGRSVNNMSDFKITNRDQLTVGCMQDTQSKMMTEEEIKSILKSTAESTASGLALGGAKAESVSNSMMKLSSTIHRTIKNSMEQITEEMLEFDQAIEGCQLDAYGESSALNNMSNFTIDSAKKVTVQAILQDSNVQAIKKQLTTEVSGSAVAFVEGIDMDFSWQFVVIASVAMLVGGALGMKYMSKMLPNVGATVKESIKDPRGALLLVAGLSTIIIVIIVVVRFLFFS